MAKQTPLYEAHVADGAKLVDFAGWDMPIDYGSQISEHNAVRESVGMFDVSHMAVADISGGEVREFLRWLMNEYLESYYCIRDSRRRMIVRKANHWKYYLKGCGTEKLVTPADMFGGNMPKWSSTRKF